MQVVGVGAHDHFDGVQDFLHDTDISTVDLLWEQTGHGWSLNDVHRVSGIQLHSFDFGRSSDVLFFNDEDRAAFLDAALQFPWAPEDRLSAP